MVEQFIPAPIEATEAFADVEVLMKEVGADSLAIAKLKDKRLRRKVTIYQVTQETGYGESGDGGSPAGKKVGRPKATLTRRNR